MQREFVEYVRENGINSGDAVCGVYRLVRRLQDGRQLTATLIDPYNQGANIELRVFVPRGLDAEETASGESINVFVQGQWVRLEKSEGIMQEYGKILNSYLRSMQSKRWSDMECNIGMAA